MKIPQRFRGSLKPSLLPPYLAVVLLVCLCSVLVRSAGAAGPAAPDDQQAKHEKHAAKQVADLPGAVPGATYVGSETCKNCHDDIYSKHFEGTPHFALTKDGGHGCEGCHGPGSAHVEGGGDKTKIIRFSELSPEEASKRCLQCHESSLENMNFLRSAHLRNGVGCVACHSPHHSTEAGTLLKSKQTELCFGCHAAQKAEFDRPYRHRVEVGLVQCSDCHNPHGSFTGHQLRTAAGQFPVCTGCHTETAGPFAFEHVPVRQEGCTSCHTPHGSTNPRLLRVSQVNLLCLQCHTPTANSNVPGMPSFHNQSAKYQACTMCHTQIHGSNVDEFFFR